MTGSKTLKGDMFSPVTGRTLLRDEVGGGERHREASNMGLGIGTGMGMDNNMGLGDDWEL